MTESNKIKLKIIITGGGTGGHIYPAMAIAKLLQSQGSNVLYVSRPGSLEQELSQTNNIRYQSIDIESFQRKFSFNNFVYPLKFVKAYLQAKKIVSEFKPNIVFATGGYTIAPILFSAFQNKIPYIIHEPDSHLGLANRFFSYGATAITLGMDACQNQLELFKNKIHITGNPIDANFFKIKSKDEAYKLLNIDPKYKILTVTGGSQGAMAINECLMKIALKLLSKYPNLYIIHQTGTKNFESVSSAFDPNVLQSGRYLLRPYLDKMPSIYMASYLAICRAGAMTISELIASNLATIFIPYPYAAQNHQYYNAQSIVDARAGVLINQSELTSDILFNTISDLMDNPHKVEDIKANLEKLYKGDSSTQIVKLINQFAMINY